MMTQKRGEKRLNINKELSYKEFLMRETDKLHAPFLPEFEFYFAVKEGNTAKVEEFNITDFTEKIGLGRLSENPLQNLKYHFTITAALIARYCIEGGMEHEAAYSLSDLYIYSADRAKTANQLSQLHREMSADYAQRMKILRKNRIFSMPIVKCVDFIYNNLHRRLTVYELAENVGLSESYLSRLFKKETGQTVSDYISCKKIEAAKNMLKFSDYHPSQISSILAFPSQSYFIKVFRAKTGLTPKKYRDMYFRNISITSDEKIASD